MWRNASRVRCDMRALPALLAVAAWQQHQSGMAFRA